MPTEGAHGTARLFFALWPGAAHAAALHAAAGEIGARAGGRVMKQETLHLTLAFLGDVPLDRLAAVRAEGDALIARRQREMAIRPAPVFDRFGWWRHNRVVWAGCSARDPALDALAGDLCDALRGAGFALENRDFVPHVTLLRKVGQVGDFPVLPAQHWACEELVLVRSRLSQAGASYRQLAAWPLE